MLKNFIKKILKKISINYDIILNKIDEKEENINNKLALLDENSKSLTNKIDNSINTGINQINSNTRNIIESQNRNIEYLSRRLDLIEKRTEQLEYCNLEIALEKNNEKLTKVLIIGFYGAPNTGDELMLENLLNEVSRNANLEITVMLSDNKNYDVEKYNQIKFIHYPKTIFDFNRLAEKYDYFVYGGGAIIDDVNYIKEDAYKYDLGTIFIKLSLRAIAFEKKVICLGISSSNKISNKDYITRLEYIVNESTYFSLRDRNSYNYLIEICKNIKVEKLNLIEDLAFCNDYYKKINIEKIFSKNEKIKIGIIWICLEGSIEKFKILIKDIKKYMSMNKIDNFEINVIPFYDFCKNDVRFYNNLLEDGIKIYEYTNRSVEIFKQFEENDIIISSRYHGILLSYALGVPCIPICYDIHEHYDFKIKYLTELFNKRDAIKYSEYKFIDLCNYLDMILNNKYEKQADYEKVESAKESIKEVISKLFI